MDFLMQADTYQWVLKASFVYVALIVVGGLIMPAPYGRFASDKMGFSLSPQWGWISTPRFQQPPPL